MYKIPKIIDSELKNWARWCYTTGEYPHPMPPKQTNFARFFKSDESKEWENVTLDSGEVVSKSLRDHAPKLMIDEVSAQKVQKAFDATKSDDGLTNLRRVWIAEWIGFGDYTFDRHPVERHLSAQKLKMAIHHYESYLSDICTRVEVALK